MAYKKYKVKKNDTFASLGDPQVLMRLNPGVPRLSTGQTIRVPLTKGGPAGYYSTGPGEYKTFSQGGDTVRMGPNTTVTPKKPLTFFQKLFGVEEQSDALSGVRGAVPPGGGAKQASPVAAGTPWGQIGSGFTPYNPIAGELAAQEQFAKEQADLTQTTALANVVQGEGPKTFVGNYGIPDTVRNTLAQNWQGSSISLDMASNLYPNKTNAQLVADLQASGATFNMKTGVWDFPAGLSGGTTSNPNTPSQDVKIKTDASGRQAGDRSTNYGQYRSRAADGRVINRDTRNIKPLEGKWKMLAKKKAQSPLDASGEVNSLVTWRV